MAPAGGSISRGSTFSHDAKLILSPSGSQLKLYSSVTAEHVGTLEGHDADITCVATHPKEPGQVYTASKDGTIKLWDYYEMSCIKTLPLRETARGMVLNEDASAAYLSIIYRDNGSGRVITYNLDKGKAGRTAMKTSISRPLFCCGSSRGGFNARTFVATFDKHSLFVWRVAEEMSAPLNLHHTKPYTCCAISSDETMIAAGDASGRIQIWRNFGQYVPLVKRDGQVYVKPDASALRSTTVHWHASAVNCLSFSPDGTYLLSGGREAVLVLWQVETGAQNFLPRLGGPLTGIQPSPVDPARYLVGQADNTLRVINTASMKVETSILGLRPLPAGLEPPLASCATLLQPGSGYLMVASENAEVQLFDTMHNRHVSLIKMINRNYVSLSDRHSNKAAGYVAIQPYVSHAAAAASSCLVTVDVRPDAGAYHSLESCLKFWDLANATTRSGLEAPFTLNTRVDDPHSGLVTSVSCHPREDLVVTTGADAEFRVWIKVASQRRPGGKAAQPSSWHCRSLGSYKGLPLTASAFSWDGSVMAVAAGPKVTLWDSTACHLAGVLSLSPKHQASGHPIRKLTFVTGSPYLVGISDQFLCVWNMLTASLYWVLDTPASALAADPVHPRFAVAVPVRVPRTKGAAAATSGPQAAAAAAAKASEAPSSKPAETPPAASAAAAPSDKKKKDSSAVAAAAADPAAATASGAPGPSGGSAASGPAAWRPPPSNFSHILLFDPSSPMPLHHAVCPGSLHPTLLYVPPDLPQYASASEGLPSKCSPMMVLTENRTYSYLSADGLPRAAQPRPERLQPAEAEISAYEAAFGALSSSSGQKASSSDQQDAMDVDVDASRPRWKQLFDAPSHVLPAPTALAQAFLRLLTTEE